MKTTFWKGKNRCRMMIGTANGEQRVGCTCRRSCSIRERTAKGMNQVGGGRGVKASAFVCLPARSALMRNPGARN